MDQLSGRVAVVTGAASGIGRGLAEAFLNEGMSVAMADVEASALEAAAKELAAPGRAVLAVQTDVSDRAAVDRLADKVFEQFGACHVVCNNAGVSGGGGPIWNTTKNDWSWVLGVNLMGVVHGVQAFLPRMLESGDPGHIVNTSSVLGLSTGGASIYSVTKHAVTRLSEGLAHDLRAQNAPIGVSVLCPGMIATHIVTAERNRPDHLKNPSGGDDEQRAKMREAGQQRFLENGMPPSEVARMVVDAIKTDTFYVLTHPEMIMRTVEERFENIRENRPPAVREGGGILAGRAGQAGQGGGA